MDEQWKGISGKWCWTALALSLAVPATSGCHSPGTGSNVEGVKAFQNGQPQAAVQRFEKAMVENPSNPDTFYNLAASYHYMAKRNSDQKLYQEAEGLYNRCLDLNPNHVACHRALAVLLIDTDRSQSAFTLLERWSAKSPQIADAKIELARLHEEFGENEQAKQCLSQAIDVNPNDARAWSALARLREEDGQLAQALNNYQQAYNLNQAQPGVAQRIASLQQRIRVDAPASPGTRTVEAPQQEWTKR